MAVFVRSASRGRRRPMADINVTPMVDVMLVLLVIFMVTAPLLTTGIDVDLPRAKTSQIRDPDNKAVTVSVKADGAVYVQGKPVERPALVARMRSLATANPKTRIYVRGDSQINYGSVMDILGLLHAAGFDEAALITRQPEK